MRSRARLVDFADFLVLVGVLDSTSILALVQLQRGLGRLRLAISIVFLLFRLFALLLLSALLLRHLNTSALQRNHLGTFSLRFLGAFGLLVRDTWTVFVASLFSLLQTTRSR